MLGVDWQIHANVRRICQSERPRKFNGSSIRENQQILIRPNHQKLIRILAEYKNVCCDTLYSIYKFYWINFRGS